MEPRRLVRRQLADQARLHPPGTRGLGEQQEVAKGIFRHGGGLYPYAPAWGSRPRLIHGAQTGLLPGKALPREAPPVGAINQPRAGAPGRAGRESPFQNRAFGSRRLRLRPQAWVWTVVRM